MKKDIVVTGMGVLSPAGIEREEFWQALYEGKSGLGRHTSYRNSQDVAPIVGQIPEFNPKDYIKPKKNIKVMSRDIQMGYVTVMNACQQANLLTEGDNRSVDPDRFGIIFGSDLIGIELDELKDAFRPGFKDGGYDFSQWGPNSMEKIMPLWMLKYLPNMPACHIGIALDARGPSNSLTLERCSCIASIIEAATVIERGLADVMICGSCGNKVNPLLLARGRSYGADPFNEETLYSPRPFDTKRNYTVLGEGSAAFILESKEFALARGAKPIAELIGFSRSMAPIRGQGVQRASITKALQEVLASGNRTAADIDHLNADGVGTAWDDAAEAAAIHDVLGDVPVFSGKGHFGMLGSGSGSVELVASLMSMKKGFVPATKNCEQIAADCPINVICNSPKKVEKSTFIKINNTNIGRSFAVMMENC